MNFTIHLTFLLVAEPVILGDGIELHVTPSEDSDEEKQGIYEVLSLPKGS